MNIHLHANATTTPKTRCYIQASNQSVTQLANELGVSEDTIRRWKRRDGITDGSHIPHRLQTTLTPAQERVVVELRKTLLLPLDNLLVVTREFIHPEVSRSALDRCLRRHGVANRKALLPKEEGAQTPVKPFKAYEPGFVHLDVKYLPQMPDADRRTYLFAAIDRATRWVYVEILKDKRLSRNPLALYSSNTNISFFHSADEFEIVRQQRTQFALIFARISEEFLTSGFEFGERFVVSVIQGFLLEEFPEAFDQIQIRRIGREEYELDA